MGTERVMSSITIRQAQLGDTVIIEDILLDAVNWLTEMSKPLWTAEKVLWSALSKTYRVEDFRIAFLDGEPAGCMALVDYDPIFWPDAAKGEALMIHKLAVKRFARKTGVADALIHYAKSEGARLQVSSIRLDCHRYREKLRAFYERHGFVCVDERTLGGKWDTAFYLCAI